MSKYYDVCKICGKKDNLTFEHIPPRAAFNSEEYRHITGDTIIELLTDENRLPWEKDGLKYVNQQQGMGRYSLCRDCNSNTGSWYADEYIQFSKGIAYSMFKHDDNIIPNSALVVKEAHLYPLKFFKQIISMFLSISDGMLDDSARQFILDKESTAFDKDKYKVCMYIITTQYQRLCGKTLMSYEIDGKIQKIVCSEITSFPFGFVLFEQPNIPNNLNFTDITHFCDFLYDEIATIDFILPILEINNVFPLDYRSKDAFRCSDIQKV